MSASIIRRIHIGIVFTVKTEVFFLCFDCFIHTRPLGLKFGLHFYNLCADVPRLHSFFFSGKHRPQLRILQTS